MIYKITIKKGLRGTEKLIRATITEIKNDLAMYQKDTSQPLNGGFKFRNKRFGTNNFGLALVIANKINDSKILKANFYMKNFWAETEEDPEWLLMPTKKWRRKMRQKKKK